MQIRDAVTQNEEKKQHKDIVFSLQDESEQKIVCLKAIVEAFETVFIVHCTVQ